MSDVRFVVTVDFDSSSRVVWDELVDWKAHEAWIPATHVEVYGDDPTAVGTAFTAWTGFGRLALEDRMRVTECAWDDETQSGSCEVEKLGPILRGSAGFTVEPNGRGARVHWIEDVTVRWLPRLLAPVAARLGAVGFKFGMRRLNRMLVRRN
ncbi:MAG: SRPBCC family protein [Acidimicrobiales bacterium]|nr:SRPBCC family protein [Acidimicrobiales bacterium]